MAELVTTGVWTVDPSKRTAFEEAWSGFAAWASSMDGAGILRLGHDTGDERRYVSFGAWDSPAQVRTWKSSSEFREHMAQVLQHVDDFQPSELDVVASATDGESSASAAAHLSSDA